MMRPLAEYADDAARLSLAEFSALHGEYFLLRAPLAIEVVRGDDFEFHTDAGSASKFLRDDAGGDPSGAIPEVAAVRKKPGNPWPRMISVGRNRTNDVVLRYANVSKVHAIIRLGADGALELVDKGSANGTRHNGHKLTGSVPLQVGDQIAFAGIECELLDAPTLMTRAREAVGA